jgi:glucuronate isomerase
MQEFLNDDFILKNETAKYLYHNHAKKMPIYDFHCHLSSKEIYEDKKFASITEAWLGGDHYKWRALRQYGIDEAYITGNKSDKEKFDKWAEVLPYTVGNPLYNWTHLELKRYFGINDILSLKTKDKIYEECNKKLETLTARKLIIMNNVNVIFTTDDPVDDLKYHKLLSEDKSFKTKVLPAFRPDKVLNVEYSWFYDWLGKLEKVVEFKITSLELLKKALTMRIDYFDQVGCAASDHALDVVMYEDASEIEVESIFTKVLNKEKLTSSELSKYKGHLLVFLGREYNKRNWVQQYHIGALRNVSSRMLKVLGPDTGYDAIEDRTFASTLAKLLDALDVTDELPKTILYCLNPRDNEVLAAITNCFQSSKTISKIQFGSAWWFNDQKDGMERQIEALSQMCLLSKFVGMLTDSRSFMSYTRHEYFRRILCNKLGTLVEEGLYPKDLEFLGKIVEDICYNNAVNYFKTKI